MLQLREHAEGDGAPQHGAVCRRGDPAPPRQVQRVGRPLVADGHTRRAGDAGALVAGACIAMTTKTLDTTTIIPLSGGRSQIVFRGGDGPPLVFLHGGGGIVDRPPAARRRSASATRSSRRLRPGSTTWTSSTTSANMHDLAIHYDDLFDALGLDGVPVVGHSFGGMVGRRARGALSEAVSSRLVLIAPVGLWNDEYPVDRLLRALPDAAAGPAVRRHLAPAAQAMLAGRRRRAGRRGARRRSCEV